MSSNNTIPTIDLSAAQTFDPRQAVKETDKQFYDAFSMVVNRIKQIRRQQVTRVACSFGKDSKVLLNAALKAHIELVNENALDASSPFIVTNIDTGVDDVFVRGQVQYEVNNLKSYCKANNINLTYQAAKPPARYSWAVMYCSGLKLPSFVKSSADCSVVLKIDPAKRLERELYDTYGNEIVTLLGSRMDESTRRAKSIERHSAVDSTLEKVASGDTSIRSFAPMAELSDEQVFGILRRMGTQPIIETDYPIDCYTPHNKLILKLYGDAQESCPVASFNDSTVEKRGSCGKSRFGCYLCLKVKDDASANARAGSAQYSAAKNVLAIRDWLAHHADDMSIREPLAKSVCPVTGGIVVQKNVFNAQTLEKLIYWLCQATRDDRLRAENFRRLVSNGRADEEPGYSEIANDTSLSAEDRSFFLSHYTELHQQHLIQAIDLEQILMICAIHARDGVKLPPYHALWIYHEVEAGRYIPYPTINKAAACDEVPEPRFIFATLPKVLKLHLGEVLLDSELSCPSGEDENINKPKTRNVELLKYVSNQPKKVNDSHAFTRRKILKKRTTNGTIRSVEKGRMSVSLNSVPQQSVLTRQHERALTVSVPDNHKLSDPLELLNLAPAQEEHAIGGMTINDGESLFWFMDIESDRILQRHNEFVANYGRYVFGGIRPLQHMLSFGVLQLTQKSMVATDILLARTDMYNQAGLFELNEETLLSRSVSQSEYRQIKCQKLKEIRRERQVGRQRTKRSLWRKKHDPSVYLANDIMTQLPPVLADIKKAISEMVMLTVIQSDGRLRYFDGKDLSPNGQIDIIKQYDSVFNDVGKLLQRLQMDHTNAALRKQAFAIVKDYQDAKKSALFNALSRVDALTSGSVTGDSVAEILIAHNALKRTRHINDNCMKSVNINEDTAFAQAYKRRENRMITRLSVFKQTEAQYA